MPHTEHVSAFTIFASASIVLLLFAVQKWQQPRRQQVVLVECLIDIVLQVIVFAVEWWRNFNSNNSSTCSKLYRYFVTDFCDIFFLSIHSPTKIALHKMPSHLRFVLSWGLVERKKRLKQYKGVRKWRESAHARLRCGWLARIYQNLLDATSG